ncbi:hypothetical protein DFH08DRAFT_74373 [Mycena albidolilacea]|uniref:F-box domain-containing protein n=1 Tax=Mycena albidolilacea TaxID=1033008 RepID=A0AAD7E838_9AGAR|nr:hypothetical protein DFH08DRAFT_74373 [Mycena albidolilacea]
MSRQADQLRARIVKLGTEIDVQRVLLKTLEHDRALTQRELNAILDPVARLPLEISSEIFLRSLDLFPEPGALNTPILLLSICSAWTDIALSTPALWAAIHIIFPCSQGLKELLAVWLTRACNRPLRIALRGEELDPDVVSIIRRHRQQLKHLELVDVDGDEDTADDIRNLWGGTTSPEPLPSLEMLTICGLVDDTAGDSDWAEFSLHHILELLRLSPNLVEYRLYRTDIVDVYSGEKIVLPKLRRLIFQDLGTFPDYAVGVLEYLSLPELETLSISLSDGNWTSDRMISFLERSSPPLQELVLGLKLAFPTLSACLRLIPDLRRFEVWYPLVHAMQQLLAAVADLPSLLPRLNTLVIHIAHNGDISDFFWVALSRALASRRTQLLAFHLTVLKRLPPSKMPAPDVMATFRELVMGGTEVRISATCDTWNLVF